MAVFYRCSRDRKVGFEGINIPLTRVNEKNGEIHGLLTTRGHFVVAVFSRLLLKSAEAATLIAVIYIISPVPQCEPGCLQPRPAARGGAWEDPDGDCTHIRPQTACEGQGPGGPRGEPEVASAPPAPGGMSQGRTAGVGRGQPSPAPQGRRAQACPLSCVAAGPSGRDIGPCCPGGRYSLDRPRELERLGGVAP